MTEFYSPRSALKAERNGTSPETQEGLSHPGVNEQDPETPLDTIPWPDPPDEAAFYGLAGDLVRAIEPHTEADPVALLGQFLAAFGNMVGRGPHFIAEADCHAMVLFVILVGTTSKGRKGTSWGHVLRLLKRAVLPDQVAEHHCSEDLAAFIDEPPIFPGDWWPFRRIASGLSSGEGLIWSVRDAIFKTEAIREKGKPTGEYQDVMVDAGEKDKRLLVMEPEFASTLRVLGRDGNRLSGTIRQAWDTGDLRILTKNNPAIATGAHISIIGHATKDELLRYLSNTETGNGFANRFLWMCVRRSKCLPEGGRIKKVDFTALVERLRKALEFARTIGEIKRNDEARKIWFEVYPELSEGKPGLLGAVTSRAEAQVMRLACIYALLDLSHAVRAEHLNAALALWDYCEASARFIFGDALGDPTADEILRELRSRPAGLTRTEIRDLFGRHKEASEISQALTSLLGAGQARCETEKTKGRSTERWFAPRTTATKAT